MSRLNSYAVPNTNTIPRAKKSLGQNFLQDANIAAKIVRALNIRPEDRVLEIGPGPGALTRFLLESGPKQLVLAEKDRHWARQRGQSGKGGPAVILTDALTLPWERFTAPWKFIGNLPYNVASPLMWDLFSKAPGLERAVFMIQKEVGLRLTARPGTAAYGALSVWVQSFVCPKLEFIVPPHVFKPRPKVDSAVLSFTPLAPGDGPAGTSAPVGRAFDPPALDKLLKMLFQMRRKQLGTIFRAAGRSAAVLEALGIDARLRPENLEVADFHRLSAASIFTESIDGTG